MFRSLDAILRPLRNIWYRVSGMFRSVNWQAQQAKNLGDKAKRGVQNVGKAADRVQGKPPAQAGQARQAVEGARHPLAEQVFRVRQEFANGKMSRPQAEQRLQELVLRDRSGAYWTIGFKTGGWYRWESDRWVANPQGPEGA